MLQKDKKKKISIICPFYKHYKWLHFMLNWMSKYSLEITQNIEMIIIDDGSSPSMMDEVKKFNLIIPPFVKVYQIKQDIPWNLDGVMNLGATVAETDWILKLDFDHFFVEKELKKLIDYPKRKREFYHFQRRSYFRDIKVKSPADIFLVLKEAFWKAGGYDEDFAGHIGGCSFFRYNLRQIITKVMLEDVFVYYINATKDFPDCSTLLLNRDLRPYAKLFREKCNKEVPQSKDYLRFDWERVL